MLDYDPATNLQHYPLPMARFGKNPHGENLWRIVWAPSRRMLAGDGAFRWVQAYRQIGAAWILEKWVSAWDFCQCSKAKWEETMLILGPYPARGEYVHAHTFGAAVADSNVEKLISWIEEGQRRSWQDHLDACKSEYDREERDASSTRQAIIRNALPAFGATAMVGAGGGRGTKTKALPIEAPGWEPRKPGAVEHKMMAVRGK